MPNRIDKSIIGELSICIACQGCIPDVASVVAHAGQTEQSTLFGELRFGLIDGDPQHFAGVGNGHRIEVTHAVVLGQAFAG